MSLLVVSLLFPLCYPLSREPIRAPSAPFSSASTANRDCIVVGAGLGGLSAALHLSTTYNRSVSVLESHPTSLGGVAHTFKLKVPNTPTHRYAVFDSGPSLISGLSKPSANPLRQVMDCNGVDMPEMVNYDGWMIHSGGTSQSQGTQKDGWISYKFKTGADPNTLTPHFSSTIAEKFSSSSAAAFDKLSHKILHSKASIYTSSKQIPPMALRGDKYAGWGLKSYAIRVLSIGPTMGNALTSSWQKFMQPLLPPPSPERTFLQNHFDYLSFALSGFASERTQAAPVAYMCGDLHLPGAVLDFPKKGGALGPIVDAISTKIKSNPENTVELGKTVTSLVLSGPEARAVGVILADGTERLSNEGVVLNIPIWSIPKILEESISRLEAHEDSDSENSALPAAKMHLEQAKRLSSAMPKSGSFMHLHLCVPADDLPSDLECHHSVIFDWSRGIEADQNMVIISIPTVFDKSLAPDGFHIVHAYTAACDSFESWEKFIPRDSESYGNNAYIAPASDYCDDPEYIKLKDEKADALWKAVEQVIPDVRVRAKHESSVCVVGTPLTHRRFNRRSSGTYGPGVTKGSDTWNLLSANSLKIPGLTLCGDVCFPGIGLPGVAASGTIAANTMVGVREHSKAVSKLRKLGHIQ